MDYETWLEDSVSISSTGNGGLSEYYFGTSVQLHKTLSIGINASYLFGGLSRNKTADFNSDIIFDVVLLIEPILQDCLMRRDCYLTQRLVRINMLHCLSLQNSTNLDKTKLY